MNNKSKVKAKIRKNIEQSNKTGGGVFIRKKLSDNEERIARISSLDLVTTPIGTDFGHSSSIESLEHQNPTSPENHSEELTSQQTSYITPTIIRKRKSIKQTHINECKKQSNILEEILDVQKKRLKVSEEQLEMEKTVSQQNIEIKKMLCELISRRN